MSEHHDRARRFVAPRNDLLFRWVFGDTHHTEMTADLLRAILPDLPAPDWAQVYPVDPHVLAGHDQAKSAVLDLKVTTGTGRTIDVEIQLLATPGIRERIAYYAAELLVSSIGRGDAYTDLRQAITVVITGAALVTEEAGYHHVVDLRTANHSRFTDVLSIHILELPRVPETSDGTPAWDWMRFLAASTEEEMVMSAATNPHIAGAADLVRRYNADETAHHELLAREKFLRDQLTREKTAHQQGMTQGTAQAHHADARRAVRLGLSVDQVAAITGLTADEIARLAPDD